METKRGDSPEYADLPVYVLAGIPLDVLTEYYGSTEQSICAEVDFAREQGLIPSDYELKHEDYSSCIKAYRKIFRFKPTHRMGRLLMVRITMPLKSVRVHIREVFEEREQSAHEIYLRLFRKFMRSYDFLAGFIVNNTAHEIIKLTLVDSVDDLEEAMLIEMDQRFKAGLYANDVLESILQGIIPDLFKTLTSREEAVLVHRFGLGVKELALEEVSMMFNVTRERIRQNEVKALRKLQHISRVLFIENALREHYGLDLLPLPQADMSLLLKEAGFRLATDTELRKASLIGLTLGELLQFTESDLLNSFGFAEADPLRQEVIWESVRDIKGKLFLYGLRLKEA